MGSIPVTFKKKLVVFKMIMFSYNQLVILALAQSIFNPNPEFIFYDLYFRSQKFFYYVVKKGF